MVTSDLHSMVQRVLVTGGAGFIGSHLVDVLLAHEHPVCVIDNLSYGRRQFLPGESAKFRFVEADILDLDLVVQVLNDFRPTLVYHLAAIHHIPTCESRPLLALRVNVEGTQSVLTAVSKTWGVQRIVFASSGVVYDILDGPLTEDSMVVPYDIYGASKVAGEHLVRINAKRTGVQGVVARLFNAVGPRETNPHLVPDILAQVVRGERNVQLGNLEPRRSFIHVEDAAEALYALGQANLATEYEIFNVGTEEEHSVRDILGLLSDLLGFALTPVQAHEKMRKVDRPRQKADVSRIWQEVRWRPQRSLRMALEDALEEAGLWSVG